MNELEALSHILGRKLARALLARYGSLKQMSLCEPHEFYAIRNIDKQRLKRLEALFAVSRLVASTKLPEKLKITEPEILAAHFIPLLSNLKVEHFYLLTLNSANYLISKHLISTGILNSTLVHPREIYKKAILDSAASIILLHNHPSGDTKPSIEDEAITTRLAEVGQLVNIPLLDHLIIGDRNFFSFREGGLIS